MSDQLRSKRYRFFVADLCGESGQCIELPADEARHACSVLRLSAGQEVELFDGAGGVASGRVVEVAKRAVRVQIESFQRIERTGPVVYVACAEAKGKRMDWLLEKATELSAASIRPIVFERSVSQADSAQRSCSAPQADAVRGGGQAVRPELSAGDAPERCAGCVSGRR